MRASYIFSGSLVLGGLLVYLAMYTFYQDPKPAYSSCLVKACHFINESQPLWEQSLDFDRLKWSNETGNPTGCYIVPNHIHYIYFGGTPISYTQLICILAAFKNQKPEKILFHSDNSNTFTGKYWKILENTKGFKDILEFHEVELPDKIFGQSLSRQWRKWHGSDITRIKTMMKYGGVYLDNDCYIIKSIDDYRRYEISMTWNEGQYLGNQVFIAHKDARFLKRYLDCYKVYNKTSFYYNAGDKPTIEILYKEPELLHRVRVLFGDDLKLIPNFFMQQWNGWKDFYIVHLLVRWQWMMKSISKTATYPVEFNENNIGYYPITFRDLAYDVYDIANITWPKNRFNKWGDPE